MEKSLCVSVKNYLNWADWGGKTNFSAAPFVGLWFWAEQIGESEFRLRIHLCFLTTDVMVTAMTQSCHHDLLSMMDLVLKL